MGPKQYAGIVRVKEFIKAYGSSKSSFKDYFVKSGYADHAHFHKDF
jgi:methylphosphotriester-DNA--protein-cysteine methyltransferase